MKTLAKKSKRPNESKTVAGNTSHPKRVGENAVGLLYGDSDSLSQSGIDNSLAVVAQRKKIESIFDERLQRQSVGEDEMTSNGNPVQLKKDEKPKRDKEKDALIKALEGLVPKNVLKGKNTKDKKTDAIWKKAIEVYKTNEKKGQEKYKELETKISKYQDEETKQKVITETKMKRKDYDKWFKDWTLDKD